VICTLSLIPKFLIKIGNCIANYKKAVRVLPKKGNTKHLKKVAMKTRVILFFVIPITAIFFSYAQINHYIFCDEVLSKSLCPKEQYAQAVNFLPICCVDVFVFNPHTQDYFMVLRNQKPAQHTWWYLGGRLFKGESFFDCAVRKAKDEAGLTIKPVAELGVYATIFPDSEWDCQTHTVNIGVLALLEEEDGIMLDANHEQSAWVNIATVPENPYLNSLYKKAVSYLNECHLITT
jgi:colanic acid biosynthesis protein WcaH